MSVIVYAQHKNGRVAKASLGALNLASQIAAKTGGGYAAFIAGGAGTAEAAAQLAGYGVTKVYAAEGAAYEPFAAEVHAAAFVKAGETAGATVFIAVADNTGRDLLPRVAVAAGAGMVSEITGFNAADFSFERPIFAGNLFQTVVVDTPKKAVSMRGTAFEPLAPTGSTAPVEAVTIDTAAAALGKKVVSVNESKSDRPELTEAAVVVSGGRSLKSTEGFNEYIFPLADLLGAAAGATRAAVDSGYVPNDMQVGQTGKSVAPQLYVAVGISGAIQHLAGMKDSKTIVAINKDAEAPIFTVADYGLVADLFKAVPEFIAEYKKRKGA